MHCSASILGVKRAALQVQPLYYHLPIHCVCGVGDERSKLYRIGFQDPVLKACEMYEHINLDARVWGNTYFPCCRLIHFK